MARRTTSPAPSGPRRPVEVVALCGRALSGESRPWLVEAEDGHYYFLKREPLSPDRLAMDFLMGRLAEECGLPVPPVRLLSLPESLLAHSALPGVGTLSPGIALGSLRVAFAEDLRSSHLPSIPDEIKLRCLCFDWWTRNPDRRLDRLGGDPNLLWDPVLQQVFLIDHDRCFDPEFDRTAFRREHAFRDVRPFLEMAFLTKWRTRFESAVYHLTGIWEEIPAEWSGGRGKKRRLSFTRQELEAKLIKPELPAEGLLAH